MAKSIHKYVLSVEGMRCGMCESHINNLIRTNFNVKKAKSSRFRKETLILSYEPLPIEDVINKIASIGYVASLKE